MSDDKIYFSRLKSPDCFEVGDYYLVFKEGVLHAAEEFMLEFQGQHDRISQLERENERLRAALQNIAASDARQCLWCKHTARQALEEKHDNG